MGRRQHNRINPHGPAAVLTFTNMCVLNILRSFTRWSTPPYSSKLLQPFLSPFAITARYSPDKCLNESKGKSIETLVVDHLRVNNMR